VTRRGEAGESAARALAPRHPSVAPRPRRVRPRRSPRRPRGAADAAAAARRSPGRRRHPYPRPRPPRSREHPSAEASRASEPVPVRDPAPAGSSVGSGHSPPGYREASSVFIRRERSVSLEILRGEVEGCRHVPGWSPGASGWDVRSGGPSGTRSTGPDRSRASAIRTPGSSSWARAGRARSQPDRPGLHRRSVGRLALRRAAPRRLREPADLHPSPDDGLRLVDAWVTAAVKCAPPDNRPANDERDRCHTFLLRELDALPRLRAVLCLGRFGWDQAIRALRARGSAIPTPLPRFGHGATARLGSLTLVGSYHPSQQNTFTGRLTDRDARRRAGRRARRRGGVETPPCSSERPSRRPHPAPHRSCTPRVGSRRPSSDRRVGRIPTHVGLIPT
jgi:hypothetical protein